MKCLYCPSTENLHTEHLVPRARGGLSVEGNIFRACKPCNSSKNDRLPSEWRTDLPDEVYVLEKEALKLHPALSAIKERHAKFPKNKVISIRCTKAQKLRLEEAAAGKGMGVSTWILFVGLRRSQELA